MRFCPSCKIDVFGGSVCHLCASTLMEKVEVEQEEKANSTSVLLGKKKRLKSDISQSMPARLIRLGLEIVIFCVIFVGVTFSFMIVSNWLSDQMESTLARFPVGRKYVEGGGYVANSIRYFWYAGCAIIAWFTIKYRFKFYK